MTHETYFQRVARRYGEKKPMLGPALITALILGPGVSLTVSETLGSIITFLGSVVFVMTLREIAVGPVPRPMYHPDRDRE